MQKRGGQPGYQQHLRENLPSERVDETFDDEITDEATQRLDLKPTEEFETYQFIELQSSIEAKLNKRPAPFLLNG